MKTKTATHTPGPWIYDGEFVRAKVQPINAHYPGDTVPQIVAHIEDCHEWEANARLIAAAPELLAAAKNALETMDEYLVDGQSIGVGSKQLRAAIAKAEGR